jgi:hypothetical protein
MRLLDERIGQYQNQSQSQSLAIPKSRLDILDIAVREARVA